MIDKKIEVIEPVANQLNVQQKFKEVKNKYDYFCLLIFLLFIVFIFIISILDLNEWITFVSILIGAFILEDIHHTLKRLWERF
jgi:hypothetical protein